MLDDFEKGSLLHGLTLLGCVLAVVVPCTAGRTWRDRAPSLEYRFRFAWVLALIGLQAFWQVWQNMPGRFDLRYTLPLHLCDLVVWAIPFAFFGRFRFARALLYFWGSGLAFFAFILPILREGPAFLAYWMFWIGHTQILGSAIYLVAVLRYRPTGRDVVSVILATCAYFAAVLPIDVWLEVDYGNVGPDPSSTEMLGPWPLRVAVLLVLESLLFVLMWLPWRLSPRSRRPVRPSR